MDLKKELDKLHKQDHPLLNQPCFTDYACCRNCVHFLVTQKFCTLNSYPTEKDKTCSCFEQSKPTEHFKEEHDRREHKIAEGLMVFNDDYISMAERFWKIQPFYYDKTRLWWLWNYKLNCWQVIDKTDIFNEMQKSASPLMNITKSNVASQIKMALEMVGRRKEPKKAHIRWIQFNKKAFSLRSKKTYDVTPDYFFCNPIPWDIGDSSETPIMDELFEQWVGKKYVKTLYEIIAYCCYTSYPIQALFCLFGNGRNGKSCFLRLLDKFLGSNNVTSTQLELLMGFGSSRFESFKLYRKLCCLMGETNFGILDRTDFIKKLTGEDKIGFEKKRADPFDDYNYAKIIIASNSLPIPEDTSDGFYRRWVIVNFPNEFPEGKDILDIIPEQEYRNLAKKVTEMLPILLEKGNLTNQGTIEQRRHNYVMASNPLSFFIKELCYVNPNPDYYVRYSEFYLIYCKFLQKLKRRIISKREFNQVLLMEGFESRRTHKNNERDLYVEGISLKEHYKEQLSQLSHLSIESLHKNTRIELKLESGGQAGQPGHKQSESQKIFHKCTICQNDSHIFGSDGKPYCNDCNESLRLNGTNYVSEERVL
jgi:putative DNA primase/helicase